MKSSMPDAPPGQMPAGQEAAGASVARTARLTALTAKLADLAPFTAEIIVTVLLGVPAS